MRTRWSIGTVALVAACAPLNNYERQGDKLLAQGDKDGAAKEYEWALKERPIMDFDYERISDKRQRIVGDQWKPAVASSIADKSGDSLERLEKLLKTRADVRAVAAPKDVAQPIENEVRSLS